MSKDTDYIANLIQYTVSEDHERVDLEACLEIADRVNSSKADCLEAIKSITKSLGKSSMKVVLNTLQLLETMCKNCNNRFLYELNNKKLVDALLKVVQRRRDRAKYGTKAPKTSNPLKLEAEDRILYLIQLWADTFMMHQSEFRNIHDAYRNLRKDGVQFPERDPNQKFMINFQGQTSPVFLAMEDNVTVPANNQGGPITDPKKKTQTTFKPKPVEYKHEYASSQVQNTLYDENEDDSEYNPEDGIQVTQEEVKILEESVGILKEIERNATSPADMKGIKTPMDYWSKSYIGELAKEILSDLVQVHKRLKRFLKTEKFASASQKNEAIRLSHLLSTCLSSYKTKYYRLKEDLKRIRTEPDHDPSSKYPEEEEGGYQQKNFGRLATEYDEASYDRVRMSNQMGMDPKKKMELKKANVVNNKVAPPNGWKSPLEVDSQNLGGNPDLIDLLNTREAESKTNNKHKFEERKEDHVLRTQGPDLVNDLLDINFNTEPLQNSTNNKASASEHKKYNNSQSKGYKIAVPKFSTGPAVVPPQNNNTIPNLLDLPELPVSDPKTQSKLPTTTSTPEVDLLQLIPDNGNAAQQQAKNVNGAQNAGGVEDNIIDDDDFFSDIANRKKVNVV